VTARNGDGQRQGRRQVPGASANYVQVVGGMVSCRRSACLLFDTSPARDQHDAFHAALRAMYERLGGRS
jgi:hypothetical protein